MDWAFNHRNGDMTEEALNRNSGPCRLCQLLTSQHCKRCGDYYCSEKCQHIDWPNHRYICFPIPPLVCISSASKEDDIYPVKPTGTSENSLTEMRTMIATVMKKLEIIGNQLVVLSSGKINGLKTPSSDARDSESLINESQILETSANFASDSVANQLDSSRDMVNDCDGPQMPVATQISSLLNGSRASLNSTQACNSTDNVILCCFRSTNRCAIRSKNAAIEAAYRAILEKVDAYGRDAPAMEKLPKVGTYAITMKSNKLFTRVKICNINNDKIRAVFCDYGNTVCRKLSDLRVINDEITKLPEYVTTAQLYGVPMKKYSDKIIEFLKTFERKEYKAKYIKEDNGNTYVQLYDIETNQLLNELVMKFCAENDESSKTNATNVKEESSNAETATVNQVTNVNATNLIDESSKATLKQENNATNVNSTESKPKATPKSETNSAKSGNANNAIQPVEKPPFQTHRLTAGLCNLKVIVIDVDLIQYGYMACIQKADMVHLSKVQQMLNTMEFDNEPYEPKFGEYCIAKFENDWYRGLVVTVLGDKKFEISYIDFLNEDTLTSDDIRPYPKDFNIDCYTTLCKIDGLPKKLTEKQRDFLKSEINVNDVISIDRVVQIFEGKIAFIECNDIIRRMQEQELL